MCAFLIKMRVYVWLLEVSKLAVRPGILFPQGPARFKMHEPCEEFIQRHLSESSVLLSEVCVLIVH